MLSSLTLHLKIFLNQDCSFEIVSVLSIPRFLFNHLLLQKLLKIDRALFHFYFVSS